MANRTVKAALITGGMYDRLYDRLAEFEQVHRVRVDVGFRGNHPELNAHLASLEEVPYHLVSTHTKYAPSQLRFLAPLEGFDTSDFFPALVEMATIGGALYGIPRNIDLRLLHYRTDLIEQPPATWDALVRMAQKTANPPELYGFVFTGTDSGLFGTFLELAESAGARIFPPSLIPDVNKAGGRWALGILHELYNCGAVPPDLRTWHYDEVHRFFRNGQSAMVSDWPGYYSSYVQPSSRVKDIFCVARMPAGPSGRVCCYAGSHTFALTHAGAKREEARALLSFLTAAEQQAFEASHGSVPVRGSVMERERARASKAASKRFDLLTASIEKDLFIPPKIAEYPQIEDILWRIVRAAMIGDIAIPDALAKIEERVAEYLRVGTSPYAKHSH